MAKKVLSAFEMKLYPIKAGMVINLIFKDNQHPNGDYFVHQKWTIRETREKYGMLHIENTETKEEIKVYWSPDIIEKCSFHNCAVAIKERVRLPSSKSKTNSTVVGNENKAL